MVFFTRIAMGAMIATTIAGLFAFVIGQAFMEGVFPRGAFYGALALMTVSLVVEWLLDALDHGGYSSSAVARGGTAIGLDGRPPWADVVDRETTDGKS